MAASLTRLETGESLARTLEVADHCTRQRMLRAEDASRNFDRADHDPLRFEHFRVGRDRVAEQSLREYLGAVDSELTVSQ